MPGSKNARFVGFLSFLMLLATSLAGCGGQAVPTLADVNNTNMKKLRGAYGLFQMNHNLTGPKDEEDFKSFLKTDAGAKNRLGRMGVTPETVDDIFISERDGQPFKVRYGLKGISDHAVVFEAEGVEGKRMVAFYQPREIDSAEYDQLWNSKPPKRRRVMKDEMSSAFDAN